MGGIDPPDHLRVGGGQGPFVSRIHLALPQRVGAGLRLMPADPPLQIVRAGGNLIDRKVVTASMAAPTRQSNDLTALFIVMSQIGVTNLAWLCLTHPDTVEEGNRSRQPWPATLASCPRSWYSTRRTL